MAVSAAAGSAAAASPIPRDQPFWRADQTLRKITGKGLTMPRPYYEEQIANGRIIQEDLDEASDPLAKMVDRASQRMDLLQQSA